MSKTFVKTSVGTYSVDQDRNKSSTISKQNKILTNMEKGAIYEKFVCDHINKTMEDTIAYLWKDVPVDILIECNVLLKSDKKINLCKNVLHDVGIDIIQKNIKTNKFTFIQCKNFIGSLCIKHLSGYCCVMMQSKHLNKDCIVYVSNNKISHYLRKQLDNDARHTFVHLPMSMKNTIEEPEINFEIAKNKKVNNKSSKLEQFVCELCEYSTDRSTDLERHNNTKRHIAKLLEQQEKDEKQKHLQSETFNCSYCDKSFTAKTNMYRHQKYNCSVSPQKNNAHILSTPIPKIQSDYYKIIEKLEQDAQLLQTENNLYKKINKLKQENQLLQDENDTLKKSKNKCAKLEDNNDKLINLALQNSKKSTRGIVYAKNNLKNAHRLKKLRSEKAINLLTCNENISIFDVVELIIKNHNNYQLDKYLGNILIDAYKTDNPKHQSLWNVDTTRLHFILNDNGWTSDNCGIKLNNLIINPFLKIVKIMINEYIEHDNADFDKKTCQQILSDIDNNKIHKRILKHMGAELKFLLNSF